MNSDAPDDDESDDENAEVTALCEGVDWSDEEFDVEPDNDSFVCPICRSTYPREELLAAHSLYHTQAEESFVVGSNHLERCPIVAMSGLARDYKMWSEESVHEIPAWLREQLGLLRAFLYPLMRTFVVKAMMYVGVRFLQLDAETGAVKNERVVHIPSGASERVMNVGEWLDKHVCRFSNT